MSELSPDDRYAGAEPATSLPHAAPRPELPGDRMAFGFGCLTSVLVGLPASCIFMVRLAEFRCRSLLGGCAIAAAQIGIGCVIGCRAGRWGYLRAVGWSAVTLAVAWALLVGAVLALR